MLTVKSFVFSPVQENTYIVFNENKNAIIFDPGCYFTEEQRTLGAFISDNNLKVTKLINTHCHLDHVFGNRWVHQNYKQELFIHAEEEKMLAMAPTSGINWGLTFDNYTGPLHFIEEGETISIDNDTFTVLLTPGHSPGSLSFYCKEDGFVISGDVLFKGSIGRTDLPFGNFEILYNSIHQKLFTLPDKTIVYSGHGEPTTIGVEKRSNPYVKA